MIFGLASGKGSIFGFILSIGLFGLIAFYLLRQSLWNTFGTEEIKFEKGIVHYEADYGWFKDAQKHKEIQELSYLILPIEYEDDNLGVLIIGNGDTEQIRCVTKIPIDQIEELIAKLERFLKANED